MAVTSACSVVISFSGDVTAQTSPFAAANTSSPGEIESVDLANGANTITPPTGATACTIVPPSGNTTSITLKGVTGDTGHRIHNTDPTSIGIFAAASTFVLTAGAAITNVRLIWT